MFYYIDTEILETVNCKGVKKRQSGITTFFQKVEFHFIMLYNYSVHVFAVPSPEITVIVPAMRQQRHA